MLRSHQSGTPSQCPPCGGRPNVTDSRSCWPRLSHQNTTIPYQTYNADFFKVGQVSVGYTTTLLVGDVNCQGVLLVVRVHPP